MQHLTLAEVKAKAREYHAAGKLTAQHPNPRFRVCVNAGADGHRCAVAAAFNDETIELHSQGSIGSLVEKRAVSIDVFELNVVKRIQYLHDKWAVVAGRSGAEAEEHEKKFLELIKED